MPDDALAPWRYHAEAKAALSAALDAFGDDDLEVVAGVYESQVNAVDCDERPLRPLRPRRACAGLEGFAVDDCDASLMVLYQRRRGEFLVLRVIYVPWPHPGVAPAPYPEPSAEDWEIAAELMED